MASKRDELAAQRRSDEFWKQHPSGIVDNGISNNFGGPRTGHPNDAVEFAYRNDNHLIAGFEIKAPYKTVQQLAKRIYTTHQED
jgi:hypothetical protein